MAHVTLPKKTPLENRAVLPAARHGGNAGVACPAAEPPVPAANDAGVSGPGAVLALDLGTVTGWACRTRDGRIVSGTEDFQPRRFEGGGMRFLRFQDFLLELATRLNGVRCVFFEEVRRHAGTNAAHIYGGFLGGLCAWCEEHEIPYQGVPVGTIKRHVTGKGNASKDAVIEAVRARGFAPADDNEADALALLLWATESRAGGR